MPSFYAATATLKATLFIHMMLSWLFSAFRELADVNRWPM